jgi:hypothetical protein
MVDDYGTTEDLCWCCQKPLVDAKRNGQEDALCSYVKACRNVKCKQWGNYYSYAQFQVPVNRLSSGSDSKRLSNHNLKN